LDFLHSSTSSENSLLHIRKAGLIRKKTLSVAHLHHVQTEETNYKNLFLQMDHVPWKHELLFSHMVAVLTILWLHADVLEIHVTCVSCSRDFSWWCLKSIISVVKHLLSAQFVSCLAFGLAVILLFSAYWPDSVYSVCLQLVLLEACWQQWPCGLMRRPWSLGHRPHIQILLKAWMFVLVCSSSSSSFVILLSMLYSLVTGKVS
jgi:hypothetical protein